MIYQSLRSGLLAVVTSVLVAACGPDTGSAPVRAPAQEPSQNPVPTPSAPSPPPSLPTNRAPTISGTPPTSVTLGGRYDFTPTASDADGDALVWSISGKPPAATFSAATGSLTWTPETLGTWSDIIITVSDSKGASTSLAPFSIVVRAQSQTPAGSASLSWTSPSQYVDGTRLQASDLTGFAIYSGTNANALQRIAEVDGRTTSFVVGNLSPGTHYFAVTSIAAGGVESAFSAVGQKIIPAL